MNQQIKEALQIARCAIEYQEKQTAVIDEWYIKKHSNKSIMISVRISLFNDDSCSFKVFVAIEFESGNTDIVF